MLVSAFTFIRNGDMLGYPYIESIKSVLPLVDEFIVNVGPSEDDTLKKIKAIDSDKIKVLETPWNENMRARGFVYGQQKMVAQYSTKGDWAFYVEGDEVIHEDDIPKIRAAMQKHLHNDKVEALTFDYLHFYGNKNTYVWSPSFYRREARIIKNSVRTYAPDGLYWVVLESKKKGRYPYAAHTEATMYHYGWMRSEEQTDLKDQKISRYWNKKVQEKKTDYTQVDSETLRSFEKAHPSAVMDWLPSVDGLQKVDPNYILTKKDKRNRLRLKLEKQFGWELSKKHFHKVKV